MLSEVLVSENCSVFTSAEFNDCQEEQNQALDNCTLPPSSNGLPERAVQTVKAALKKATFGTFLETLISRFIFQYWLTPYTKTGVSPAELLMNCRPHHNWVSCILTCPAKFVITKSLRRLTTIVTPTRGSL